MSKSPTDHTRRGQRLVRGVSGRWDLHIGGFYVFICLPDTSMPINHLIYDVVDGDDDGDTGGQRVEGGGEKDADVLRDNFGTLRREMKEASRASNRANVCNDHVQPPKSYISRGDSSHQTHCSSHPQHNFTHLSPLTHFFYINMSGRGKGGKGLGK